ncbi:hypothetical protein B9T07_26995, partial [Limnospira fusiformis CCALA 023]
VEVFLKLDRVALHSRNEKKYGYSTLLEHMPSAHKHYYQQQGWDHNYYLKKAADCGPSTAEFFKKLMDSKFVIHQAYQSFIGLIKLAEKYGPQRMESACQRALKGHRFNYKVIELILINNMDQINSDPSSNYNIPENPTVRGAENYKK